MAESFVRAPPTTRREPACGHEASATPKMEGLRMAVTTELPLPRPAVRRHRRLDVAGIGLWSLTGLVFAFLFAPIVIIFLTSFTASRAVEFPPQGVSLIWYGKLLDALRNAPGLHPGLARSIWFSTNLGVVT